VDFLDVLLVICFRPQAHPHEAKVLIYQLPDVGSCAHRWNYHYCL